MKRILLTLFAALLTAFPMAAQYGSPPGVKSAGEASAEAPGKGKDIKLDPKLGAQVPLEATFRDESGKVVTLGSLRRGKPVILTPVYYDCPMLCNMVLDGLVSSIRDLRFDVGDQYDVITFSFNPADTPQEASKKKDIFVKRYGRPGAGEGWHFLSGDEANIRKLADSIGFRYAYDSSTGQYAHAAMTLVLTPDGKIARYFYGIEYRPRDLRLALVEAADRKIATTVDRFLLLCYHYDPATGKYSSIAMNVVRAGGIATVFGLAGFIALMIRREKHLPNAGGRNL
jgi:protein SCO1/2